jgi:CubicO group peptidase (beta-lactamase class C family)
VSVTLASDPGVRSAIGLLEAWLESQLAYRGWPGLSIGILHDQELIWARGFGHASLERAERATPDTLYRIASITKLFTSTAILQLRDAGKLRLDDPLTQHVPWFNIGQAHPDAPPITIQHLLTHTAGLPRELGFPYWTDSDCPTAEAARKPARRCSGAARSARCIACTGSSPTGWPAGAWASGSCARTIGPSWATGAGCAAIAPSCRCALPSASASS